MVMDDRELLLLSVVLGRKEGRKEGVVCARSISVVGWGIGSGEHGGRGRVGYIRRPCNGGKQVVDDASRDAHRLSSSEASRHLHGGGGRRDARRRRRRRSLGRQGSSSLPCGSCARRAGLTQPPARAGCVRYEIRIRVDLLQPKKKRGGRSRSRSGRELWKFRGREKTAEAAGDLRFRVGFVGSTQQAAGGSSWLLLAFPIRLAHLTYLPGVRPRPHPLSWHVAVVTVPSTSRLFLFPSHLPPWRPSIF